MIYEKKPKQKISCHCPFKVYLVVMRRVFLAYGMAVKGGAAGDHVPHEVGALLLEGPDDDCPHMFLLHWTLDNTKTIE